MEPDDVVNMMMKRKTPSTYKIQFETKLKPVFWRRDECQPNCDYIYMTLDRHTGPARPYLYHNPPRLAVLSLTLCGLVVFLLKDIIFLLQITCYY